MTRALDRMPAVDAGRTRRNVETTGSSARLELLTAFELTSDGEPVRLSMPAQRLLAFLALQDRPLFRDYVAGTLWPDCTDAQACGSLRSALWRVRQPGHELIEAVGNRLRLSRTLEVDLTAATQCARRVLTRSSEIESADRDRDALSRDLLLDWYDDWVVFERERFRQLRIHALESLCERLTTARRFAEAIEAGLAAVDAEPFRESAHRALIKVHLAEGNVVQAIRQYESFSELMRDQLNLRPSPQITALVSDMTVTSG